MMIGQGYNQILEMIMKRIPPEYIIQEQSSMPVVDPEDKGNPYDPRGIDAFQDYDYHLEYNTEDDLVSFTSHDGTIRYTLNKDSFDGLVTISVHTPRIDFKIALIYEFYDIRENDPETDEKGKLTDVVIMMDDGKPFPLGLSVSPEKYVAIPGDTVYFKANVTNVDGSTFDCTNEASWATNGSYQIINGAIFDVQEGITQVSAMYGMCIAYAELNVMSYTVAVEPASVLVEYMGSPESVPFRAYGVYPNGKRFEITQDCIWSTSQWNGSQNGGAYSVNVDSIAEGTVTATYKNKSGNARIKSTTPQIEIVPSSASTNVGNSYTFSAKLSTSGQDVTNSCIWSTDRYDIDQDGSVIHTDTSGIANISATYMNSVANAILSVEVPVPEQIPSDQSGSGKFNSTDFSCGQSGTIIIDYDMYGHADEMEVYRINSDGGTGTLIDGTGGRVANDGTVSFNVSRGQKIRVIISSDSDSTAWEYHVHY